MPKQAICQDFKAQTADQKAIATSLDSNRAIGTRGALDGELSNDGLTNGGETRQQDFIETQDSEKKPCWY